MAGPPEGMSPADVVSWLLQEGRPPCATVPFPRRAAGGVEITYPRDYPQEEMRGKPVRVFIRLLDQLEEDNAWINGSNYAAEKIKGGKDLPWPADEVFESSRAAEILALACRREYDPERPFFQQGIIDLRKFTTDELAQLYNTYRKLKADCYPGLRSMDKAEYDWWIAVIKEGAAAHPFGQFSRTSLETFCDLLVKDLVDLREKYETATSSSTEASAPT